MRVHSVGPAVRRKYYSQIEEVLPRIEVHLLGQALSFGKAHSLSQGSTLWLLQQAFKSSQNLHVFHFSPPSRLALCGYTGSTAEAKQPGVYIN